MIFGVVVLLAIASGVIYNHTNYFSLTSAISAAVCIMSALIAAVMLCCIMAAHIGCKGTIRKYEEQYKGIIYKAQTKDCRDEFGILNKAFVDEVQDWNMMIASHQAWKKDLWIGIFFPPVYDNLQLIDINEFSYKTSEN